MIAWGWERAAQKRAFLCDASDWRWAGSLSYDTCRLSKRLRSLAHACVLVGLLSFAGAANAQPVWGHGIALRWTLSAGAEQCVPSAALAQRVEQRLGREVFSHASDPILVIDGGIDRGAQGGFHALIRIIGPDGTLYGSREVSLPDADCHKLDDVIALIISVTLRNEAGGGSSLPAELTSQLKALLEGEPLPPAPSTQPTPASSPPAAKSGAEPRAPAPAPSAREENVSASPWHTQIEAGFSTFTGIAPALSFAPLLRGQLQLQRHYSLALEGRLGLVQAERIASEPRGSIEYQSAALAVLACYVPLAAARIELALCFDVRIGDLSVRARNFLQSFATSGLWVELALAASLRAPLAGPTFVQLRAGVPWRALRPRFQYEDSQGDVRDAFTVATFGVDLSLGVGVEF